MVKGIKTKIEINGKIDLNKLTESLVSNLNNIQVVMRELSIPQEVLEKEIKTFGNASHIILPKEYADKKAIVIIKK